VETYIQGRMFCINLSTCPKFMEVLYFEHSIWEGKFRRKWVFTIWLNVNQVIVICPRGNSHIGNPSKEDGSHYVGSLSNTHYSSSNWNIVASCKVSLWYFMLCKEYFMLWCDIIVCTHNIFPNVFSVCFLVCNVGHNIYHESCTNKTMYLGSFVYGV
jgi:hypothetical protein